MGVIRWDNFHCGDVNLWCELKREGGIGIQNCRGKGKLITGDAEDKFTIGTSLGKPSMITYGLISMTKGPGDINAPHDDM